MLYADGALGIALLLLWVYALFDVLTADSSAVRNLPKLGWFAVVLLLGELAVGPVLWFLAGRPRRPVGALPGPAASIPPEYDRPGRARAGNPDDDAAFLSQLRERADQQRREAADQARRRREQGEPPV